VSHSFVWNISAVSPGTKTIKIVVSSADGGTLERDVAISVSQPPRVVINEIMYHPTEGDDGYGEWVEIYNPNDFDVNLSGWWIGDSDGGYTFPQGTLITAKGFLVVARDTTWVISHYSSVQGFDGSAVLGNATFILDDGGDTITLKSSGGSTVDSVTYDPSWGGNGDGKSLERKDPFGPSNDPSNWGESAVTGGTPTYSNSIAVPFFGNALTVALFSVLLVALFVRRSG
jgi:hypothetical protein